MTKARILIVDDQEEILDSLRAILSDEGHDVITARDGQEALHIVQSDSPDVVFLDIWIPGIDGLQTLKAVKKISPSCSVIMMSGHGTIETAVKAIKLGATDYLEKPLNLEDVLHLVQKAVSSKSQSRSLARDEALPSQLIGNSEKVVALRKALEGATSEQSSVWLSGEKGTGKEFVARIIHHLEGKERSRLAKIRCTELTEENFEEVLLGKENGTGTGRLGKLAQASGGSLLLVRVDRLDLALSRKIAELLRKNINSQPSARGLASLRTRVVSTSTCDPEALVREGTFSEDLASLIGQKVIRVPPLRERSEDIPLFVAHFLQEAREEFERDISGIDEEALARLTAYAWPGNVKQLKILIEHVVMTAPGPEITVNDLLIPADHEEISGYPIDLGVSPQTAVDMHDAHIDVHAAPDNGKAAPNRVVSPSVAVEEALSHQKTLRGRVVMYGQGLHSGIKTGLTLSPLPPFSGILFGHITSGGTVPALLQNVESTGFSTCLRQNGSFAKTIEHLMAVFHVYGLTNVLVKISGEVPIMDGSALEFCRLVESAEIILQDELVEEVRISEPFDLPVPADSPKSMSVEPSDRLEVEYYLDYPPPVGSMHMTFQCNGPENFKAEIAPARTFGFVRDMRMMDEMGLAGGGRLSNVVLLDEEKVVNPPLRFEDEFVRHKILDIIGDFYLLGRPFIGKIIARQTGHTENIAMLNLINEKMKIL